MNRNILLKKKQIYSNINRVINMRVDNDNDNNIGNQQNRIFDIDDINFDVKKSSINNYNIINDTIEDEIVDNNNEDDVVTFINTHNISFDEICNMDILLINDNDIVSEGDYEIEYMY